MSSYIRSALISTFIAAVALPSSVFAENVSHKGHMTIEEKVVVADHELAPGEYQVRWQDNGATTEVSFIENGKTVATATAQVVALKTKPSEDTMDTMRDSAGRVSVREIRFSGQTRALDFGTAGTN